MRRDVRCCYVIRCKVMSRKLIGRNVFLSGCCMAQRLRCPGGRPSVSYEKLKYVASKESDIKTNNETTLKKQKPKQTPRECNGDGGQFHGQLIKS